MFQVRIHGRGGQGVVTAAEMLSIAAFEEGRHAQAFPSFGSERTGAPVVAFCRIADKEIRLREPIMEPDALIIQDPTLLLPGRRLLRLKKGGYILINTSRTFDELGLADYVRDWPAERLCTVPATDLSRKHVGRPMPNVPLAGRIRRRLRSHPAGVGDQGHQYQVPGEDRHCQHRCRQRGLSVRHWTKSPEHVTRRPHMLKQTEGSHAVAEAVGLCRPEVICAYPISPQTHIVEGLGEMVKGGEIDRLRVHQRRIRVRGHERRHRFVGNRCAHLHRHRFAGHSVHGRGGL
jgi:pyruvate ferredoxin oxidoreductase gamma subunit